MAVFCGQEGFTTLLAQEPYESQYWRGLPKMEAQPDTSTRKGLQRIRNKRNP